MINLREIRSSQNKLVILGNHPGIIQSILDFDYLSGKAPSVALIIGNNESSAKYFWGKKEILLPIKTAMQISRDSADSAWWFLNLLSGRRALKSTLSLLESKLNWVGGAVFAENMPERDSQALYQLARTRELLFIGPSSVGMVIPGELKLGAIGGVTPVQIQEAGILKVGNCAVISASGGMVNELINMVKLAGKNISFALSTGGDRFPLPPIKDVFLLAQKDPTTEIIVYYGELGGTEEYELIEMKKQGLLTKKVIVHIAGTVSELFAESPQFGHAKAKANTKLETARAKRQALLEAGFLVPERFANLLELMRDN